MATLRFPYTIVCIATALAAGWLLPVSKSFGQQLTGTEIGAISEITILPGHEPEVRSAVEDVRSATLKDPGCLTFFITEKQDAPSTIVLFETFGSQDDFERHVRAPATKEFLAKLKGRVEGDTSRVTMLRPSAGPVTAGGRATISKTTSSAPAGPSLPSGVDHVGLTVPDINEATRFFEKAFGATAIYDVQPESAEPMAGPEVERELGFPPGAKIVHMRLMRIGTGPSLELFKIEDAPQRRAAALNDYGWTHIALYVEDIHTTAEKFEAAGGKLLSPPHGLAGIEAGDKNRGLYGRAPWGSLIELITYPSGIKYPDPQRIRWTPPRQ
jgi:quinol monooxygenase YgiN/catechol 2,3-dioxygenase-like lactoylglutathione lyase family enzyme